MKRIGQVQDLLKEKNLAALIVDNPVDLFYLTGQDLSLGRLVVTQDTAQLFVDGRYFEACQKKSSIPVLLTAGYAEGSAFANWWKFSGKKVGFDADYTSFTSFENLAFLGSDRIALKSPIKSIREIKEERELDLLKEAAELGSQGYDFVCKILKEGITEKQVVLELTCFWLKKGGEALAFAPHIAFGEGTSQPHYRSTDRPLNKGDLILIDIGVVRAHYNSDMTRVLFFGNPPQEIQKIYESVYDAFHAARTLCRAGVKIGDVDRAARGLIEERGYTLPHGLGHGVGLEVHESPRVHSKGADAERELKEGMVITIEPGIYLPGKGGIRLEDTFAVTKEGCASLTNRPISPTLPIL